ncbi:MAG TPA: hypothetical protein DIW46_02800 [Microbacterium sp.]|nr:hypothetical protein [Microbacterium sp.]
MHTLVTILAAMPDGVDADEVERVLKRLDSCSNQPNAVKAAAKLPSNPALERAALALFEDSTLGGIDDLDAAVSLGFSILPWGLLTLAARADITVLDRLPADITERGAPKIASIRRAAKKHEKVLADASTMPTSVAPSSSPALPEKIPQVARWVKDHPDADPALFAAHDGQRSGARRVALRVLGAMASPAAFEVLAGYAQESYSRTDLAELHRAWSRFDRRVFAATMFRANSYLLHLDVCASIEGIGAVPGLVGLQVLFDKQADLTPLVECTELRNLHVRAIEGATLTSIEPLTLLRSLSELHLDGDTSQAELDVLEHTGIERLDLSLEGADAEFLTRMPKLKSLKVSTGETAHPGLVDVVVRLVQSGIQVVMYRHETSWLSDLMAATPNDITVVERSGYVGLTRDADDADALGRRLLSNIAP